MNSLDIFVQQYFSQIRTESITEYTYLLSRMFDVSVYSVSVFICVVFLIYIIRGKKFALLFGVAMFFQAVIIYLLKNFFDVSRPTGAVMDTFGKSFPSYHATAVTVFFVMLMYIFDPVVDFGIARSTVQTKPNTKIHYGVDSHFKKIGRILFNTFCIIMIILVASSRLYLGVHWLSDVLAGIVFGGSVSYTSIFIFKKIK